MEFDRRNTVVVGIVLLLAFLGALGIGDHWASAITRSNDHVHRVRVAACHTIENESIRDRCIEAS